MEHHFYAEIATYTTKGTLIVKTHNTTMQKKKKKKNVDHKPVPLLTFNLHYLHVIMFPSYKLDAKYNYPLY